MLEPLNDPNTNRTVDKDLFVKLTNMIDKYV